MLIISFLELLDLLLKTLILLPLNFILRMIFVNDLASLSQLILSVLSVSLEVFFAFFELVFLHQFGSMISHL